MSQVQTHLPHKLRINAQRPLTRTQARAFAESVDVITYEFENIPTDALDVLEAIKPIYPNREALRISQDRTTEKIT